MEIAEQESKKILDACCGSRMFWFDKQNPDVLFADIRDESDVLCDGRTLNVSPDIIADFTNMPFEDNQFHLVVFDPPHLKSIGESSWMAKKYGRLPSNWKDVLRDGFNECMRVLKPNGVLVFKWNEDQVKIKEVLSVFSASPLFGHRTMQNNKTMWICFMKS